MADRFFRWLGRRIARAGYAEVIDRGMLFVRVDTAASGRVVSISAKPHKIED